MVAIMLHSIKFAKIEQDRLMEELKSNATVKFCPPHPWAYHSINGVEKIWCPRCRMVPGETTYTPRGDQQ